MSAPDDDEPYDDSPTDAVDLEPARGALVHRFRLIVVEGPAAGRSWESTSDRCAIGSHPSNELVIDDSTVSRFHCEILLDQRGARVRDLDSKNGTVLDGVMVLDGFLRDGSVLKIGHSTLRFELGAERNRLRVSERRSFGALIGASVAMRTTFAQLELAAASNATVLVEGETGTGKEGAASSIHAASARASGPLVVIDCGSIPKELLESELFGHERGAFTGAVSRRIGAFEEANGGTIFLDEIGELPMDLQPKLLRVLESREIRRVGTNQMQPIDVRVVAATHRDLRAEVNAGRFRSDLYFRLAVLKVVLPPLRSRPDDIPLLVDHFLNRLRATPAAAQALRTPAFLASLRHAAWPGNVRQLRNHVERCLVFQEPLPLDEATPPAAVVASAASDEAPLAYEEARRMGLAAFERSYVEKLLAHHGGKVAQAAAAAGMDRVYLYRLMRRHGLKA